jgi:hypothetical protein
MQYDGNSDTYYDDGQPDQSAQDFAVMPDQGYPPAPDFAVQPPPQYSDGMKGDPSPMTIMPASLPPPQYSDGMTGDPSQLAQMYADYFAANQVQPMVPPPNPSYDPYAQYGTPVTPSGYDYGTPVTPSGYDYYGTPVTPSGYDPYAPVEAGRPIPSYDEFLAKYKADNRGYMAPMIAPAVLPAIMGQGMGGQRLSGPYGQGYMAPSAAPAAAGAINPQMLAHGISGLVSALSGMTGNRTPSGGSTPGYDGQQLPPRLVRP